MASNMLSKFISSNISPSIYEDMQREEEDVNRNDIEARAGTSIDEENLGAPLEDYMDHPELFGAESQATASGSIALLLQDRSRPLDSRKPRMMHQSLRKAYAEEEDGNDDVPASLLIEGAGQSILQADRNNGDPSQNPLRRAPPSTSSKTKSKLDAAREQQQLYPEDHRADLPAPVHTAKLLDAHGRAMWTWLNASNLDSFMGELYDYYTGKGIWCICVGRLWKMLTIMFVTVFVTFLGQCIDYHALPTSKGMADIIIPHCTTKISGLFSVVLFIVFFWTIWTVVQYAIDIARLVRIHDFYLHLLGIPDSDMQTITWQDVVGGIMALRESHPLTAVSNQPKDKSYQSTHSRERLDAHDIANRLMRKDNYMIAIFNKDILDLRLPIPGLRHKQLFSRTLLWNLSLSVLDFMFTEQGQVKQLVLKDTKREELAAALRRRFYFCGFVHLICAPFIISYIVITYFFQYFNEFQKNPSKIGARKYTTLAEWKFREFNELPHLFEHRLNMSYPFASRYLDQYPKVKTVYACRFVAFVAGSLASVLGVAAIIDSESFLAFEVTPGRTALFYITVLGAIWAAANGSIPDENLVFEPEYAVRNVIEYTHYMPSHWNGKLHSDEVKREFAAMYQMKVVIFLEELLCFALAPLVLWFSLPNTSLKIVDFFREFTVHVDGLGYVCSFAVFDFKKGVRDMIETPGTGTGDPLREDYYSTKHGKMAASFYGFLDNYAQSPKTGIPGHIPPGTRRQPFLPPPVFPGLPTSPTHVADLQRSRAGGRTSDVLKPLVASRALRRPVNAGVHASPMASALLDPRNQPAPGVLMYNGPLRGRTQRINTSNNLYARAARSTVLASNIREDDEDDLNPPTFVELSGDRTTGSGEDDTTDAIGPGRARPYSGLEESNWETSPLKSMKQKYDADEQGGGDVEDSRAGDGVLGMINLFYKAQKDGKGPGVGIGI